MNRKMIALVMFVIIGVLVVSAFSWTPDHIELNIGREADAARYTAEAEFFAAKEAASIQRGRDADSARYTAMAKLYAVQSESIQYGPPGR